MAAAINGCTAAQNAQTMNDNKNQPTVAPKPINSAQPMPTNGQVVSGSMNPNTNQATSGGLAKYKDKKIDSLPRKAVSAKYVVEHRTALNDKTVSVSGVIVEVFNAPAAAPVDDNSVTGVRNMANPQPRIVIADESKSSRDKNRDLIVIVEEGDRYAVGQKVNLKVRVESSRSAVVLRKVL